MSQPFLFKTKKFPSIIKDSASLSKKNCRTLLEIGLPQWVAPHLYFGDFNNIFLPKLKDWPWISDWKDFTEKLLDKYEDCRIIGSSDEHAPIFLKPNKNEIYTFIPKISEAVIVNTSIEKLLQALDEYAIMIEIAFFKNKKLNLGEDKVSKEMMERFLDNYKKIEAIPKNKLQFWHIIAEEYSK